MRLLSREKFFVAIVVCGLIFGPEFSIADEPTATTSVSDLRGLPGRAFNTAHPIALNGIVTLTDPARNMFVLQDGSGAIALHPDPPGITVQPGQRVLLKSSTCAPYNFDCPQYPFHPLGQDIRATFEAPDNEGDFRLTRMRGWLRPAATGNYTFWISSDDSSDLWLSESEDGSQARRIAFVPSGGWAHQHEWTRFPSQHSESIYLQAGKEYYIEALQEQQLEDSHLAVAWEGPGIDQSAAGSDLSPVIIDGQYLVPWHAPSIPNHTDSELKIRSGILREYWSNYSAGNVTSLTNGTTPHGGLTVKGMEITPLAGSIWPKPLHIEPGMPLAPEDIYRWVEGEGAVSFLGTDGSSATVELTSNGETVSIKIEHWSGAMPQLKPNMRAKFHGVCEGGQSANSQLIAGFISVQTEKDISFFESSAANLPSSNISASVIPVSDSFGGYYAIGGVVTFHDLVFGKPCLFVQDTVSGIFVSQAERSLDPSIQVGQSLGIGGRVIPGKYGAGVLPHIVNILGRQNLPTPVIAPDDGTSDNYRDGLWTEVEGVAAAVNSDGTLTLIRKRSSLQIWVGHSTGLKKLLNGTLRIRGVLSLATLKDPVLLVPSLNFVETVEPAPITLPQPQPVATIKKPAPSDGWTHQVNVVGTVTFRDNDGFFLQDKSGSVRVLSLNPELPQVGAVVEAVGFPQTLNQQTCLTEAIWKAQEGEPEVQPVTLEWDALSFSQNDLLVSVQARLLSQGINGSNRVVELEAGQQVFEATLPTADGSLSPFEPDSILEITGIAVLKSEGSSLSNGAASVELTKILMRSPNDVRLMEGAPWWTWKRTAILICLLSAVIFGSILRIRLLDRRFLRQQIARREFAREMLKSQESERRRIAASLHDSLGQDLLVIRNQAFRAIQSSSEDSNLRQRLEEISSTTQHALDEVREITHNLRPYQLDRLGLTQAIRALTRRVSDHSSVEFACHVDDIDGLFDAESEIHIYRIVQESVTNVLKHSGASEATLVVKLGARNLSISVRDNGKGLSNPTLPTGSGFGLGGIQERCQILLGSSKIDSSPGNGFNLQLEIPLPSHKSNDSTH